MTKCVCKRCAHEWLSRVENPKCCPACKSRAWTEAPVQTALEVDVSMMQVGDVLSAKVIMCGEPAHAVACARWLAKVVRVGRRLGFKLHGELESGQPPRARRIA